MCVSLGIKGAVWVKVNQTRPDQTADCGMTFSLNRIWAIIEEVYILLR